jgi:hypothetical protein
MTEHALPKPGMELADDRMALPRAGLPDRLHPGRPCRDTRRDLISTR